MPEKINGVYPHDALILAPLAGFTDIAYRRSARRHGCRFAFTEMVDAGALAHGAGRTLKMLTRGDDEPWLGAQLVGAVPSELAEAAKIVSDMGFDVVDFNLGCPAPKVAKKGEGAALASTPEAAAHAFEALARNSRLPATAKIRILHPEDPAPTVHLAQMLENTGASAITIHGRTKKQFYSGPVNLEIIRAVSESISCQVVANGGVTSRSSYDETRRKTGLNAVMVARGAMGNPWIFRELASPETWQPPTPGDLADEVERHVLDMVASDGLELGLKKARKIILDYMRGRGFPRVLKTHVIEIASERDLREFTSQLRSGPTGRGMSWFKKHPDAERRLTLEPSGV